MTSAQFGKLLTGNSFPERSATSTQIKLNKVAETINHNDYPQIALEIDKFQLEPVSQWHNGLGMWNANFRISITDKFYKTAPSIYDVCHLCRRTLHVIVHMRAHLFKIWLVTTFRWAHHPCKILSTHCCCVGGAWWIFNDLFLEIEWVDISSKNSTNL